MPFKYKFYRLEDVLWLNFIFLKGQLTGLGKLAFGAIVTAFFGNKNFTSPIRWLHLWNKSDL